MRQATPPKQKLDANILRKTLPDCPGVYSFLDHSGRVIYVGKAKNLRKRVLSYFRPVADLSTKTGRMMKMARGLDFIVTSTEQEAFILESNLIKKQMPRYNIILRDDKQYPCLRLNMNEPYPRLSVVRNIKRDGALYFGPFSSATAMRSTRRTIDRVFKLRKCRTKNFRQRQRPCLNFQMDRCLAPCSREVPEDAYKDMARQVRLFLEGRNTELIDGLQKEMNEAAACLDFERAAGIRDQIGALKRTIERQHIVSARLEDQDVIGLARSKGLYQVVALFIRKGRLTGTSGFLFREDSAPAHEVMEAFLKQYYSRQVPIPGTILISEPAHELESIMTWLSGLAGRKVVIRRPQRGEKKRLTQMAVANAEELLVSQEELGREDLLVQTKSVLGLRRVPRQIEGLDISNLQGDMAVGTVVSFRDGQPRRQGYRNYRIRGVDGIDDYGMMAEMVERRLKKGNLPDLFLVDGGKGHLRVVSRVVERHISLLSGEGPGASRHTLELPEVISIAKADMNRGEKGEKIYIPGRKNPVVLRPDHPVLLLMMRIRDETHRRAVSYHRNLRKKRFTRSDLDSIPGIGKQRKQALLLHFKTISKLHQAKVQELERVPGISKKMAETVFSFFHGQGEGSEP